MPKVATVSLSPIAHPTRNAAMHSVRRDPGDRRASHIPAMTNAVDGHSFMVEPSVDCPAAPVRPMAAATTIHAGAPRSRPTGNTRQRIRSRKNAAIAAGSAMANATARGSGSACASHQKGRSPMGL